MEMVWSYTEETARKHSLSGLVMESPRKERKSKIQKQLETKTGDRVKKNRYIMEVFREDGFGYKGLGRYGCGPVTPWDNRDKKKKKNKKITILDFTDINIDKIINCMLLDTVVNFIYIGS
jgi:hypothetical protein